MAQKSLKKNAVFNLVKAFNSVIFPIISFPYASRILMPDGIGKVNFANSVIDYFILIAGLGVRTYAAREASKIRDDKIRLNKFSREIFSINLLSTFIAYLAMLACLFAIPKFSDYLMLLIICSTKILFTTAGMEWLYVAEEEYGYITMRSALFQATSLVLLFMFVHSPSDYLIYAGIGVFSNAGSNIFNFFYSRKFVNLFEKTKLEFKKHLKPIMVFFGSTCATKINSTLDALMLGFLANDVSVGLYSAAIKISRLVIELITSVVSSFMPRSSYYIEKNMLAEYKVFVEKICGLTFFFSIPFSIGLFTLCEPLIVIFSGEQYLPAIASMKALSFSTIASCATSFLTDVIVIPHRKEKIIFISQIIALCVNAIFNTLLIRKWNVFGAAIATVAVEVTLPFVRLPICWKYLRSKKNLDGILKAAFGAALMYIVIYFSYRNIENDILKVALSFFTGCAVYAVVEILLRHQSVVMIINVVKGKFLKRKN